MNELRLQFRSVTKRFPASRRGADPVTAVQDVNFAIRDGEVVSIIGPSGCGKSTLLNMGSGLDPVTEGEVFVDGERVTRPNPHVAFMLQKDLLLPWRTIRQNVEFGLEIQGKPADERRAVAIELLAKCRLSDFVEHYPHQLSGGMRQRAALARSLANDPEILLMDEPFAAVDAMTRQLLQDQLVDIVAKTRKTVIFVTHSIDEALILSDRITVFSSRPGRVKAILENDLPKPRSAAAQLSPRYLELKSQIWDSVQEEVLQQIALMERIQR